MSDTAQGTQIVQNRRYTQGNDSVGFEQPLDSEQFIDPFLFQDVESHGQFALAHVEHCLRCHEFSPRSLSFLCIGVNDWRGSAEDSSGAEYDCGNGVLYGNRNRDCNGIVTQGGGQNGSQDGGQYRGQNGGVNENAPNFTEYYYLVRVVPMQSRSEMEQGGEGQSGDSQTVLFGIPDFPDELRNCVNSGIVPSFQDLIFQDPCLIAESLIARLTQKSMGAISTQSKELCVSDWYFRNGYRCGNARYGQMGDGDDGMANGGIFGGNSGFGFYLVRVVANDAVGTRNASMVKEF